MSSPPPADRPRRKRPLKPKDETTDESVPSAAGDIEPAAEAEAVAGDVEPAEEAQPGVLDTLRAIRHALAPIGKRRLFKALLVLAAVAIPVVIIFSGFSMWWTSQPSFCGRCHVMEEFVVAWEESPHADVNCERCHTPTGTLGFLGGKIAGLQVVLNYFRGHYEDTSFNAAVPNANCLQCHRDVTEEDIVKDDIRVRHKEIVENGGKCMFCHSVVAHGDSVPYGSRTEPKMASCFKCHDGQLAPLECATCHEDPPMKDQPESHPTTTVATTVSPPA